MKKRFDYDYLTNPTHQVFLNSMQTSPIGLLLEILVLLFDNLNRIWTETMTVENFRIIKTF